jgi:membrane associated rhomboid family serine protease
MSLAADGDSVIVFRGSRQLVLELALALEAQALPYELVELDVGWALAVSPEFAAAARAELDRYLEEREVKRPAVPVFEPFGGVGAGALTYTFVLLAVAYCAGISALGRDWFASGAVDSSVATRTEWWRAVTALTLHAGPEHLVGNLLFGIVAGGLCGRLMGPGVGWFSILLAGAAGNFLELWIAPAGHRAVGASTAVFAGLGLLTGFAWRQGSTLRGRRLYRSAPLIAGFSLLALLGAGTPQVDVLGHLLGFLAGLGLGWVFARLGIPASRAVAPQAICGVLAIAVVVAAWTLALA